MSLKANLNKYRDPNVFRPDGGFRTDVVALPQSIRCPHCRQLGTAAALPKAVVGYKKKMTNPDGYEFVVSMTASVHLCPNTTCHGLLLVVANAHTNERVVIPPELIDFDPTGLPSRCQRTIAEAAACLGAGAYRASAMMIRRLLEEVCEENEATGKNLHDRLKALTSKIVLPKALFDAMDELKLLGNDAAHIEAKNYDEIGQEEAETAIELAKEIMKGLYQLDGLVARLQARKKPAGPGKAPTQA